jgi:hypothetical protein
MDTFQPFVIWSNMMKKETDIAIKVMAEMISASTKILNTMAGSGAEIYRQLRVLQNSQQEILKLFIRPM